MNRIRSLLINVINFAYPILGISFTLVFIPYEILSTFLDWDKLDSAKILAVFVSILAALVGFDKFLNSIESKERIDQTKLDKEEIITNISYLRDLEYQHFTELSVETKSILDTTIKLSGLQDLSLENRKVITKVFSDIIFYHQNIDNYESDFRKFSYHYLEEQSRALKNLNDGKLKVSGEEAIKTQSNLLKTYTKRFDAVSLRDTDFWVGSEKKNHSPFGLNYLKLNREAVSRNISCSRIFIYDLKDILEQKEDIIRILEDHSASGIKWGIVFYDEVHPGLESSEGFPDFALFDHDMALTYFTDKNISRKFQVIFKKSLDKTPKRIQTQIEIYTELLSVCRLVSDSFAESSREIFLDQELVQKTDSKAAENLKRYSKILHTEPEHEKFLLVAKSINDVREKVDRLIESKIKIETPNRI